MKSYINGSQGACLAMFGNGDFAHLAESTSEEEFKSGVQESGDGLLRFLITELATSEGCDSIAEAINRVHLAIAELLQVQQALEKELDKVSDTHVRVTLGTRLGRTGQFVIGSKDPIVWDDPDGDDETTSATFDLFRLGKTGDVEIIETAKIDGDRWRDLEMGGGVDMVRSGVHLGMTLSRAIANLLPG